MNNVSGDKKSDIVVVGAHANIKDHLQKNNNSGKALSKVGDTLRELEIVEVLHNKGVVSDGPKYLDYLRKRVGKQAVNFLFKG